MSLSLVDDAGAVEPVTLGEAKLQLKLPVDVAHPEDSLIEDILIPAARARGEGATNRAFRQATWSLILDASESVSSDGWIEIPKPPLVEVLSVTYVDTNGITQTFATSQYLVQAPAGPKAKRGRLSLAYGAAWPSTRDQVGAVTIQFVAGYSLLPLPTYGPSFPAILKMAMLLDIATLYAQRENVVTGTIVGQIPGTANDIYKTFKSWPTRRLVAA